MIVPGADGTAAYLIVDCLMRGEDVVSPRLIARDLPDGYGWARVLLRGTPRGPMTRTPVIAIGNGDPP
ncbi:hypothetical protein EY04_10610 [Pseudomonas chlororaphis]|nr:hypothetical protein EY04_10610 [Pseudomonas chlororaphis]